MTSLSAQSISRIPPFPAIATRMLQLLSGGNPSLASLASLIRADVSLTAQILQRANSPLFRVATPITDISQAVLFLGFDTVKKLAVTAITVRYVGPALASQEVRQCWRHSLACGFAAQDIATFWDLAADRCYMAGLLHDIGRIALMVCDPTEYSDAIREASNGARDILDCERERFGVDHAEAGRVLAENWRLPREIMVAAGRHHDALECGEINILSTVQLACRVAHSLGFGREGAPDYAAVLAHLPPLACQRLPKTAERWKASLEERVFEFEKH